MDKLLASFLFTFLVSGITICGVYLSPSIKKDSQTPERGAMQVINKENSLQILNAEFRTQNASEPAKPQNTNYDYKLQTINEACDEWERVYKLLSKEDKKTLRKEGVVHFSDEKYQLSYYVLSSELVSNCEQRVKIGQFIWQVILGLQKENEKQFAEQNSKEIVKVLRHIWSSRAFSSDGVHQEKYNLLLTEGIKDEDVALLLDDLLRTKTLNIGLLNILLKRPSALLKPTLSELLKKAESKRDLIQQIYYLIILQQISPEPGLLVKLDKVNRSSKLSNETRAELTHIINKFQSGDKVEFEDMEKLNLPLSDYEEAGNLNVSLNK